jgi:hypothetical protein
MSIVILIEINNMNMKENSLLKTSSCLFVRYNPDSSCFNIGNVICEINNVYIKYVTDC